MTDTMLRTARMLPVAIAVVGLVLIAVGEGTTQGLGAVLVGGGGPRGAGEPAVSADDLQRELAGPRLLVHRV